MTSKFSAFLVSLMVLALVATILLWPSGPTQETQDLGQVPANLTQNERLGPGDGEGVAGRQFQRSLSSDAELEQVQVRVMVVDLEAEKPVGGALVRLRRSGVRSEEVRHHTPDDGLIELGSFLVGAALDLEVSATGYSSVHHRSTVSSDSSVIRVELAGSVRITGTVKDAAGHPIPKARVLFRVLDRVARGDSRDDGTFSLENIPATRRGVLEAHAKGFRSYRKPLAAIVGQRVDIVLDIARALHVSINVPALKGLASCMMPDLQVRADGQILARQVLLLNQGVGVIRCDDSGASEIEAILTFPEGKELRARGKPAKILDERAVVLTFAEIQGLKARLRAGDQPLADEYVQCLVNGRVTIVRADSSGMVGLALPGAPSSSEVVTFFSERGVSPCLPVVDLLSGPLTDLELGDHCARIGLELSEGSTVDLQTLGLQRSGSPPLQLASRQDESRRVFLVPPGSYQVKAMDRSLGEPVTVECGEFRVVTIRDASAKASVKGVALQEGVITLQRNGVNSEAHALVRRVNPNQSFEFKPLHAGHFVLQASFELFPISLELEVKPGETIDVGPLGATDEAASRLVRARVQRVSGQPVANAKVHLEALPSLGEHRQSATTNADGVVTFRQGTAQPLALRCGDVQFYLPRPPNGDPVELTLPDRHTPVTIRLPESCSGVENCALLLPGDEVLTELSLHLESDTTLTGHAMQGAFFLLVRGRSKLEGFRLFVQPGGGEIQPLAGETWALRPSALGGYAGELRMRIVSVSDFDVRPLRLVSQRFAVPAEVTRGSMPNEMGLVVELREAGGAREYPLGQ